MKFNTISINQTEPLPYISNFDNQIYEYNPFIESSRGWKRVKSNSWLIKKLPTQLPRSPSVKHFPRRKKRSSISNPFITSQSQSLSQLSDSEFSFNSSLSSDSSDLESLPDLTEDDSTPNSSPIKVPPTPNKYLFQDVKPTKNLLVNHHPSIFEIPEIAYKIIEYADIQNTIIPQETAPIRRKPLSYNHALLIHGNKEQAELALRGEIPAMPKSQEYSKKGTLHNCLQVNRLFNQVTHEILSKKFFFSDEIKFNKFLTTKNNLKFKPSVFVLHKLFHLKQSCIESIKDKIDFSNLEWIELYMCPRLTPTPEFFVNGSKIKKLIITGSKAIDDNFLIMVSERCPNLEVLDIRACELISDSGIYHIAKNCKNLVNVNFGRKNKGHLITDSSLSLLINNNNKLSTVGLAGCHISDKTVWDLALNCNKSLQRLSLNNCSFITNQSIPLTLQSNYFMNLSVLELRFLTQITNLKPIIEFKRRQEYRGISILIEVCETLCLRMREQELEMDKVISQRILKDILDWANDTDDGDLPFQQFIDSRRLIN